jgi:hypothetical protein
MGHHPKDPMRLHSASLAAPLVALLLACGTQVEFVSLPTRPLPGKLQRVFIVYTPPAGGSGHLQTELDRALGSRFKTQGVTTQGWVKNFLDLQDDAKLAAAQTAFTPQHLLVIRQSAVEDFRSWSAGAPMGPNGTSQGSTYSEVHRSAMELELRDASTQEVLWKGRLACKSSGGDLSAPTIADRILAGLIQDGLLTLSGR